MNEYKNDPSDIIFETQFWIIKIDKSDQTYLGRSFVILKRKCGDLAKITEEELLDFHKVVGKFQNALIKSFRATMFNWSCLMNNAYQKTPPDPQVHWHVRPRYKNSVEFESELFVDEVFGHHYARNTERSVSEDVKLKIIKKIQESSE